MLQHFSGNTDSFNFNFINNFAPGNERLEILAWLSQLSQLDPRKWHRNIQLTRVDNVGDWFLRTHEFRDWCGGNGEERSDGAALFCCGDLGVGKTYISSLVVDKLGHQSWGQDTAVACSYYDFASQSDQLPASVLGSLLQQLVVGLDDIPEELVDAFKVRKRTLGGQPLQLAEIIALFPVVTSSRRTLICIDALDECVEGRLKLLTSLGRILRGSPGTRLFLTGRPHIQSEIEMRLGEAVTIVSIATNKDDVARYFYTKLEDLAPDAMDSNLEADIVSKVTETMSKMFRLASLNIDGILRETTIYRRRKRLNGPMDGSVLKTVYGPTLDRIEYEGPERRDPAMAALMWVCYSERPLRIDELRHALAVEIGSTGFESSNVPSEGTLLSCCQGLVIVDRQSSTARLIHPTLKDYLCAHLGYFVSAHSKIAETCLTYLNSQQVKDLSAAPFLSYASRYWGTHAKMELSENAKSLALQLFGQYDGHISARILLQQVCSWGCAEHGSSSVFTGLHCASFFGIAELVDALMGMESCGINKRDSVGVTPLIWAAMCGHQEVVELFLGRGEVDLDVPDRAYGRTALLWAKMNGHAGVVKLLLGR